MNAFDKFLITGWSLIILAMYWIPQIISYVGGFTIFESFVMMCLFMLLTHNKVIGVWDD